MLARALIVPVVAISAFAAAAPPAAQPGAVVITGRKVPPSFEPVTRTVKIGDLNLATGSGVKQMEKRVAHGVAEVCPMPAGNSPNYERRDYEACRKFAMDGARPQMDRALAAARMRRGMK